LEYPDFTEEFYKFLYFELQEVWQPVITQENRIKTMPIIILGTSGMGKTTLAKNVMKKVESWYCQKGVCPVYTNEVSLGELMICAFNIRRWLGTRFKNLPQVYVLTFDDATAVPVEHEEVRTFFSIRHEAEKNTGVKEGIVYSLFLTHDWYYLHKLFRRYGYLAVILSVPPLDTFARRQVEHLLGKDAVTELEELFRRAVKEDKYKGTGFVRFPYIPEGHTTNVGKIRFSNVDTPYVKIISDKTNPEIFVDPERLELHIPAEQKKDEKKEELQKLQEEQEKQRRWSREGMRKLRERRKKQLEEARRRAEDAER